MNAPSTLHRAQRWLLIASTIAAGWLGMMVIHECGHVLHAAISGGHATRVVLHPLGFSRTEVEPNPHPALVAAGGFLWGSMVPLVAWLLVRKIRLAFLLRFWSGFCLLANGAYMASAAMLPAGDTEDLIRLGVPRWALVVAGIPLCAAGLALWNGLGAKFGLGQTQVDRRAVFAAGAALITLTLAMLAWSALTPSRAP